MPSTQVNWDRNTKNINHLCMKVVVYFITYMAISLLYRLVLVNYADPKHRQNFELVKLYQLYDNMLAFVTSNSFSTTGLHLLSQI